MRTLKRSLMYTVIGGLFLGLADGREVVMRHRFFSGETFLLLRLANEI